jgi:NarL family two-component system response regulator LiaR
MDDVGKNNINSDLTAREIEVLRLVGEGKTNKEIGDVLCISVKTVETHVSNVYLTIGVACRAAAIAWAVHNLR